MTKKSVGKFISIEGPDGSGKSSLIKELTRQLTDLGYDVLATREPGGSPIAERIREVILDVDNTAMDAKTEALLFAAARRQHLVETILPAIEAGKLVLTDRFIDSSIAYQGVARGIPAEDIWTINQFGIEDHLPDMTLLIDVPAEVGLERIYKAQGQRQFDRLDQESIEFHQLVRDAFLEIEEHNERVVLVDGNQSVEDVSKECLSILKEKEIIE
ncbi:dTMP kinase [Aerococcaceae bacterium WGS1372]